MRECFRIGLISLYSQISALGLRQVSACLRAAGFETTMIFLPDREEWLSTPGPHPQTYSASVLEQVCDLCSGLDLVGIGVMTNFVGRARALTGAIQERLSIPVIWGGIHPTVEPAESLAYADYVCVGEGEGAVVDLADRMACDQPTSDIPNIWTKDEKGNLIANPVRSLNRSLEDLPLPEYELERHHILHEGQVIPLTSALLAHYMLGSFAGQPRVAYTTYMTRGCPRECTYCCSSALAGLYPGWHRLRRRSPERVVAEINAARRLIPALQVVMFLDDTFLAANMEELQAFSEIYREHVGLPFFILCTPQSVTEEKIGCLVKAGLQDVEIGLQTGSRRIQTLFGRPGKNEDVLAAARCLHRFEQWIPHPRFDIISDNPYETEADQLETLRLLYQLPGRFLLYIFSLAFYPGTALYRKAKEDGLIEDEEQDIYCHNILQANPTYYNLVLWCIHRHLPRWLLWLLIQPLALRVFNTRILSWLINSIWTGINSLRRRRALFWRQQQISRIASHSGTANREDEYAAT